MNRYRSSRAFAAFVVLCMLVLCVAWGVSTQSAPKYKFDPDWPKTLPNKWKMGGVTGLAVDKDDNVWVYDRPNDLRDIELDAEIKLADCCARPPSMIHIDKAGNVIGSFDPPQGHGMGCGQQGVRLPRKRCRRAGHRAQIRSQDRQAGCRNSAHHGAADGDGGGGDAAAAEPVRTSGAAGRTRCGESERSAGAAQAVAPIRRQRRLAWRLSARSIRRRRR